MKIKRISYDIFFRFHKKKAAAFNFCSFCSPLHCSNLYEVWALLSQYVAANRFKQFSVPTPIFAFITIHIVVRDILCGWQHKVSGKKLVHFKLQTIYDTLKGLK